MYGPFLVIDSEILLRHLNVITFGGTVQRWDLDFGIYPHEP